MDNNKSKIFCKYILLVPLFFLVQNMFADDFIIGELRIEESAGIDRDLEYVNFHIQLETNESNFRDLQIIAKNLQNGEVIPCQVFNKESFSKNLVLMNVIFPISINANEIETYILILSQDELDIETDLILNGKGFEIIVENKYYKADLTQSFRTEAKSNSSGQLNELMIKMGFDKLLLRTENRMHWAPNFQKGGIEYYETIAGWENPKNYQLDTGAYLIYTHRKDIAPKHPEILLTANYYFYSGLPYFRFFSSMDIVEDVSLLLLRNDEMTMDSLFTHIAYQNNSGEIIDLPFSERYNELKKRPIENDSPWLCFYNDDEGYAFGSIRIMYDNTNQKGMLSPTYFPHTKISDGAEGGKYWNRRLIDEKLIFVPEGSLYVEENAYLVFEISKENKFKEIEHWAKILLNPLGVKFSQVIEGD